MRKLALELKCRKGDGCVAAFFSATLKAAGCTAAGLVASGKEREKLLQGARPVSKKKWESLGEAPSQAGVKDYLTLLEAEEPQLLWWIGTKEEQQPILGQEGDWICIREEALSWSVSRVWHGVRKQRFDYQGGGETKKEMELPMPGDWQVENAAKAIAFLQELCQRMPEIRVTEGQLRRGILQTTCPGCFQVQGSKPQLILDRAANRDAVQMLKKGVERMAASRPVIGILGMARGSEEEETAFLEGCCSWQQMIFTVSVTEGYRAYELAERVKQFQENVTAVDSPEEALELARLFAEGQTKSTASPIVLLICPRELQEKLQRLIWIPKKPHRGQHQR